ncbi:MAG: 23S rRNA (pseudouridine(1915)-N(3))-methyltransferase RlmH [bacterium]|nr:23S rRNA (pseudouridine(1915)-N(3))-methyltransferase RlmH [bacterium]
MKITVYSIGKTKENYVLIGETKYLKRLKNRAKIEIEEIINKGASTDPKARMLKEADLILDRIKESAFLIALDERGENLSSEKFSEFLGNKMTAGISHFVFVIGGAFGLHEKIRKRANYIMSLSKMTFPHELARLFLIEQIYRAFSIQNNEPYHK